MKVLPFPLPMNTAYANAEDGERIGIIDGTGSDSISFMRAQP